MAWYKRENRDDDLSEEKRSVPAGVFTKCPGCRETLDTTTLEKNDNVCPQCQHHFPLTAARRLELLLDPGSFVEADGSIESVDPLGFRDSKKYSDRLRAARRNAGNADALLGGSGRIEEIPVEVGIFVFEFMGGSMGSVVGEKVTRVFERALERKVPAMVFSASGGARMQEGVLSLMQMAKTSAALARFDDAKGLFISVLTDPTTGGVTASFAMLGDVIIAEPKALIGFAGPRVIEQTVRETLPEGFQRSEFLLEHGALDMIVDRRPLRTKTGAMLAILTKRAAVDA